MNMPGELKKAIDAAAGAPVEIVDGERHYVVISAETYERLAGALDIGELSDDDRTLLLRQWGKASGWDDPADDVFDSLEPQ